MTSLKLVISFLFLLSVQSWMISRRSFYPKITHNQVKWRYRNTQIYSSPTPKTNPPSSTAKQWSPPRNRTEETPLAQLQEKVKYTLLLTNDASFNLSRLDSVEKDTEAIVTLIEKEKDEQRLLSLYFTMLRDISLVRVDSLQTVSFRSIARAVFQQLFSLLQDARKDVKEVEAMEAAETRVVDEINDRHLSFIDSFKVQLDTLFKGATSYQGKSKLFFVYQLASLLKGAYQDFGIAFDAIIVDISAPKADHNNGITAAAEIDEAVRRWAGPVLARLKRKFPDFNLDSLSAKLSESYSETVERLFDRFPFSLSPEYSLAVPAPHSATAPPLKAKATHVYSAARLADSFVKLIRHAMNPDENPNLVEIVVASKLKQSLLARLRPLTTDLEEIMLERTSHFLEPSQQAVLDKAVTAGQEIVAAVYAQWQLKHNIIGFYNASSGSYEPEYVRPVPPSGVLDKRLVYASLPENISVVLAAVKDNEFTAVDKAAKGLPADLEAYSLMAAAVRMFATEQYEALILDTTTSSSSSTTITTSDVRQNFNAMYCAVLTQIFFHALVTPSYDRVALSELLIGAVALEVVLNVREPRKMALVAYEISLYLALSFLYDEVVAPLSSTTSTPSEEVKEGPSAADREKVRTVTSALAVYDLPRRLNEVELCLHYFLDATSVAPSASFDNLFALRSDAFQTFISRLSATYSQRYGSETGLTSFLQRECRPMVTSLFSREEDIARAQAYVVELGLKHFQETLTSVLGSVDLVLSLSEMGDVYLAQLLSMGKELFTSDELTMTYIRQLVEEYFATLYDVTVEEAMSQNLNRVESYVVTTCKLFSHPLLQAMNSSDVIALNSLSRYVATFPREHVIELIKVCERSRAKLTQRANKLKQEQALLTSAGGMSKEEQELLLPKSIEGWGSDSQEIEAIPDLATVENYQLRLHQMQLHLLKEVTTRR
eukprot:gene9933-10790_t